MPTGIYIAPYKRYISVRPSRYCMMNDANGVIFSDGGDWTETEILHTTIPSVGDTAGKAIVRVRASTQTLSDLATVYRRLPKDRLDDSLSDLSNPIKRALRNELEDCGYSLDEIHARFGNDIGNFTLRQVVEFAASRRLKPRYDAANDRIVCDGIVQTCRDIVDVERQCFSDEDWSRLLGVRDTLLAEWDADQKLIRLSQHPQTTSLPKWERDALLGLCGTAGYAFDKIRPDTFPTTSLLDDANRANDATPPPGAGWGGNLYSTTDEFQVLTNQFAPLTTAANTDYWGTLFSVDQEAFFDLATKSATNSSTFFVELRVVAPGTSGWDGYEVEITVVAGTDEARIYRVDNEAWTQLGATGTQEFASGESLGGEAIGSTLTLYRKAGGSWASVITRTDATYAPANSYIGMGIYGNGVSDFRIDNFSGGTVVVADVSAFPPVPASRILKTNYSTLARM